MLKKLLTNRAFRNYVVDLAALLPFLCLLGSGIVMLIYRSGVSEDSLTLGFSGHQWRWFHQRTTLVALPLVLLHLLLHWAALRRLFLKGRKAGFKPINLILLILFLATSASGLLTWLWIQEEGMVEGFQELHNKLGMALVVFFALHLAVFYPFLIKMSRKHLGL